MRKTNITKIAVCGVFGALGFVLMLLEFPLAFVIPNFVKLDFSEIPALIVSFCYGPLYGVFICLLKNLIHLFITSTAGVGELANFLLGAVFVGGAGLIYRKKHSKSGALIATLSGALLMGVLSVPINYFITYPFYANFMPMDAIIEMYKIIYPKADTLLKALVIFNFPFTFLKGVADSLVCFAVYKRLSPLLKKFGKL